MCDNRSTKYSYKNRSLSVTDEQFSVANHQLIDASKHIQPVYFASEIVHIQEIYKVHKDPINSICN